MDEHDGLEPTASLPRVESPASVPAYLSPQPIPPQPDFSRAVTPPIAATSAATSARPQYRFGNPVTYTVSRFFAFALDVVVVSSVATMLLYGLIAINPFTGLPVNSEGGFDATFAMGVGIAAVYLWLAEAIFGTTLGKLAFGLHVFSRGHAFVGLGRSFIRNILRPIDLLVIGWILALLPGHRRLGDLFGGTVVARSPLRWFAPLLGWAALVALCVLPFFVAGGTITILAVGTAFVEFIPRLLARGMHALLQVVSAFNSVGGQPAAPGSAPAASPPPSPVPSPLDSSAAVPPASPVPSPLDSSAASPLASPVPSPGSPVPTPLTTG